MHPSPLRRSTSLHHFHSARSRITCCQHYAPGTRIKTPFLWSFSSICDQICLHSDPSYINPSQFNQRLHCSHLGNTGCNHNIYGLTQVCIVLSLLSKLTSTWVHISHDVSSRSSINTLIRSLKRKLTHRLASYIESRIWSKVITPCNQQHCRAQVVAVKPDELALHPYDSGIEEKGSRWICAST